ncbi:hypothetical protein ERO13_D11G254000v2 [Gossypium hirsutum]|uniref:Rapid alkalinization factor 1 n=3 Tax=Gossypium TaxID=3633 RepID=A0A5J5PGL3_GOSBA|nr:hypothetical protein ES319_1Z167800v1 [Gossypium barbadense]KAG4122238.1 hypothetical protein ERO13_D11G253900v2 [Gossypium hirsutum]TYG46865.1 hypothetical protein ES288_D11G291200v1 [Gossypium darwinii]TYI57469.1 hypothetical protein E1A91_D11G283600v1 [Gossypium mustelinum]KAB1670432.1 hypothetical protein ES319_1Z167900v1 [Gossypium barbadense]
MGVEKKIMVLWICSLVISSMVMEEGANATPISYPGLGKNLQVPCKLGGGNCLPPPSNGYDRGCSHLKRCRSHYTTPIFH